MQTSPHRRSARTVTVAGVVLGLGLGGFVDGIVLHQILQWHHLLTDYGSHDRFPATTVPSLEDNTLWDGLFHLSAWFSVAIGLWLLWRGLTNGERLPSRGFVGLLLAGWGVFNLVEGIVDHHVLTIHHVRDDVADPLWWDLGFLAFGAILVATGVALYRDGVAAYASRPQPTQGQRASRASLSAVGAPTNVTSLPDR